MNTNIVVSIVMITYSHEKFIREAIIGVLKQEVDFEIELIIADDNSPYNIEKLVKSFDYHSKFKIIKYTKHRENMGMMPNFIWALQKAKGKYIAICEGDDYWTDPYKLQKQVDFLVSNMDCEFCFHKTDELEINGTITNINYKNIDCSLENLVNQNFIHTVSVVFRKEKFEIPNWFYSLSLGDYPLWLLMAQKGKIGFIDETMAVYRKGVGIWNKEKNIINQRHLLKMWFLLESNIKDDYFKSLINKRIQKAFEDYDKIVYTDVASSDILSDYVSVKTLLYSLFLKILKKLKN